MSQQNKTEQRDAAVAAGAALELAVSSLLRWATRSDVRRSLLSPESARLSSTDTWLLGRIVGHGPMRLSDLAGWQGVDKSTMTAQVQRLERRGLVRRRSDADDRRAVLAEATPKGRAMHEMNRTQAGAVFGTLVAGWSSKDQAEFARLMGKLVSRLEERGTD